MKVLVIGAGPGGYQAAILAAKLGADVTIIEKDTPGGTCLNRGCIPTKALLATAEALSTTENAEAFGLMVSGTVTADFAATIQRKDKIVKGLVKGIEFLFDTNKVTLIKGMGKLIDAHQVEVLKEDGSREILEADKIILATGSVPMVPAFFNHDGQKVITSDEVLKLTAAPKSLIVAGGGVIGCEIGQWLKRMGTQVTVVEMADQLLPHEDEGTAKELLRQFKKDKIKVLTGSAITGVDVTGSEVTVSLANGTTLSGEMLLVALGRRSLLDSLNVREIGIKTDDQDRIVVNDQMETSVNNIYAVGDLVDSPQLAHMAAREGLIAAQHAVKNSAKKISYKAVPRCVYTDPEVASVGLTEKECLARGISYRVGRFDFRALGKARTIEKIQGFVKIIVDDQDVIIGAVVVGAHGTELLAELTLAVQLGLTAEMLGDSIHPHPTLSEAIMEAAHDVHGVCIHKP